MMAKKVKALEAKWLEFEKTAIPVNAPAIQKKEMRRAFYFGASTMFELITDVPEDLSEDETCKLFSALQEECSDFLSRVGKDY